MKTEYYIISLKHTHKENIWITLWRPNNAGYSCSKETAGVYQEIKEGYHNCEGDSLPIDKAILDEFFIPTDVVVSGPVVRCIPNCKQVWVALHLKMTKTGLVLKK